MGGGSQPYTFPDFPKKGQPDRTQIVTCSPPLPHPHTTHTSQEDEMNHFQVTRPLSLISSLSMTHRTPRSPPTLDSHHLPGL